MATSTTILHKHTNDSQSVMYETTLPEDTPAKWITIARGMNKLVLFLDPDDEQFLRAMIAAAQDAILDISRKSIDAR